MNNLKFDLNELVSNEVAEQIESLEQEIKTLEKQNYELRQQNKKLQEVQEKSKVIIDLFTELRGTFDELKHIPSDKDGWGGKSKQQCQFEFIEQILLAVFKVNKECERFYGGGLSANLAINYYTKKDLVINIVKLLIDDHSKITEFIKSYRMPYDYSKDEVIAYCKAPNYNTNGCIFGIGQYWVESGAGKKNMPHNLIMMSPFIVESDVFEIIITSINKKVSNYYYLYALSSYATLTDSQIKEMGETLISLPNNELKYTEPKGFLSRHLKDFNEVTLSHFYNKTTSNNHYNTLHWENFPFHYQRKFLLSKNISEILKITTDYSCKWTDEQKEQIMIDYANQRQRKAS